MPLLTVRSTDTMKASRDNSPSSGWTTAFINQHVNSLASVFPSANFITYDGYLNNEPYHPLLTWGVPWCNAIHATGKNVFFRMFPGNFPNTFQDRLDYYATYLPPMAACFADGDMLDVIPESSPENAGWGGATTAERIANWNRFVREVDPILENVFQTMGKNVNHRIWSQTDQTAVFGSKIERDTLPYMNNVIYIDFYPMDAGTYQQKADNFISQLSAAHTRYPHCKIWVTETGYNNTTAVTDEDQRAFLAYLFDRIPASTYEYFEGFNYWCGYGNVLYDKTRLYQSLSRTNPRPAAAELEKYYAFAKTEGNLSVGNKGDFGMVPGVRIY